MKKAFVLIGMGFLLIIGVACTETVEVSQNLPTDLGIDSISEPIVIEEPTIVQNTEENDSTVAPIDSLKEEGH